MATCAYGLPPRRAAESFLKYSNYWLAALAGTVALKGVDLWIVAPNPCLRAVVVVTGRDKGMPVYLRSFSVPLAMLYKYLYGWSPAHRMTASIKCRNRIPFCLTSVHGLLLYLQPLDPVGWVP
jgi:hypothetical protein